MGLFRNLCRRLLILKSINFTVKNFFYVVAILVTFITYSCVKKDNFYSAKLAEISSLLKTENQSIFDSMELCERYIIDSQFDYPSIRKVLYDLLDINNLFIISSYVDEKGILRISVPTKYSGFEGADINHQSHVKYVRDKKTRFIARKFRSAQGVEVFSYILPIIKDSTYRGAINVLLSAEQFIVNLLRQCTMPPKTNVMFIQSDGEILYSDIPGFTNSNILSPEFIDSYEIAQLLNNIIRSSGEGTIHYFTKKSKKRNQLFWKRVKMEINSWTLILIKED